MADAKKAAVPKILDKDRLLRQVRRMNARAESEREERLAAQQARLGALRDAAEAAAQAMRRLRGEREGTDYLAARDRRDAALAEAAALQQELDPLTEFYRMDAAISAAKAAVRRGREGGGGAGRGAVHWGACAERRSRPAGHACCTLPCRCRGLRAAAPPSLLSSRAS
jgi:hypothetical protein